MNDLSPGLKKDGYFKYRNVTPDDYIQYKLPRYLIESLSKDLSTKILDIGCGFGQILKGIKDLGYADLYGIDISKEAVDYCKSIGLNVDRISDLIGFTKSCKDKFDFIIMNHVLEHIDKSKIIETLKAIKEGLLNKGGSFLVTVPNAQSDTGCYWAYEDFTHTTIFTAGSLYYVLKSAGFERIEFLDLHNTEGLSFLKKAIKKALLKVYILNKQFWNKVTSSCYHKLSPQIFGYEIKALASYK